MTTLTIQLPDPIPVALNRTPQEIGRDMRLYSALMLFQLGKLSSGMAAQMAGVGRIHFLDLCNEYGIDNLQLSAEELLAEVNDASQ